MKTPLSRIDVVIAVIAGSVLVTPVIAQDATPIRVGGQPTTTVEGQIAHTLKNTDILEKNGFDGEVTLFSYGPAVNEALVSGAIDVGFIGDMPSVSLAAANAPTEVIARQSVFRGSILAKAGSGIETMEDLTGRQLAGPVGSSIHLAAVSMLEKAGLEPGEDVQIINMGFADLSDGLRTGAVDAVFVWDPWVALFEEEGLATILSSDTSLTMVIAMRKDFREEHPDAAERFLKAHKEATLFAASNHDLVNGWFREPEAARALPEPIVQKATAIDPQWSAKSLEDIRLAFDEEERARYLGLGDLAFELKVFPIEPPLEEKLDMSVAEKVDASTWTFDPAAVTVMTK